MLYAGDEASDRNGIRYAGEVHLGRPDGRLEADVLAPRERGHPCLAAVDVLRTISAVDPEEVLDGRG